MKTAIFTSLIVLGLQFAAVPTYSQIVPNKKWEIGVGLRPLNFEENPYSIIVKRHLGQKWAIRLGGSFMAQSDQTVDYTLIPRFGAEDTEIKGIIGEYKQNYVFFTGIQYFIHVKNLNFFGGIDFFNSHAIHNSHYRLEDFKLSDLNLQNNEVFYPPKGKNQKSTGMGIRPFIGIQWQINSSYSLQFESSYFLANFRTSGWYNASAYLTNRSLSYSVNGINDRSTDWGFSPLSFISFNYHF